MSNKFYNHGVAPKGSLGGWERGAAGSSKPTYVAEASFQMPDGSYSLKFGKTHTHTQNFAPKPQKSKKIWWDLNRNLLPRPER